MADPADPADPTDVPPRAARRTDTPGPRASRVRALKILFQADLRGVAAVRVLEQLADDPEARAILDDVDVDALAGAATGGGDTDAGPAARTTAANRVAATRVPALDGFTTTLVAGVSEHLVAIDELISRYARRWQISRMPVVDRSVLRLATYELLHEATPPAVVLDEAVNLAKSMSTDDSGRYVNGVLESIRKELAARPTSPAADEVVTEVTGATNEAVTDEMVTDEVATAYEDAAPEADPVEGSDDVHADGTT